MYVNDCQCLGCHTLATEGGSLGLASARVMPLPLLNLGVETKAAWRQVRTSLTETL